MGHGVTAAFPNSSMSVDHVFESGGEVEVMGHFMGTHTGDLHGAGGTILASGRP